MTKFKLDQRLQSDCFFIDNINLSQLLLMNDSNYPWLILVPQKNNITELTDLSFIDQTTLLQEINLISKIIKDIFIIDKLNIATLGNVVSQLHIHIIGRKKDDASFPKPVWGNSKIRPYNIEESTKIIQNFKEKLNG